MTHSVIIIFEINTDSFRFDILRSEFRAKLCICLVLFEDYEKKKKFRGGGPETGEPLFKNLTKFLRHMTSSALVVHLN